MKPKQSKVDVEQLASLMRFKPRLKDAANFFKVSEDTIHRVIKDNFNQTFAEFRDENLAKTRFHLIQTALARAETSDTMLIFCLKNMCGWKDKHETDIAVNIKPFVYEGLDGKDIVMGYRNVEEQMQIEGKDESSG